MGAQHGHCARIGVKVGQLPYVYRGMQPTGHLLDRGYQLPALASHDCNQLNHGGTEICEVHRPQLQRGLHIDGHGVLHPLPARVSRSRRFHLARAGGSEYSQKFDKPSICFIAGAMPVISLAAGVLPEFSPQETALAAVAAGFDATGVWIDLETWTDATTREMLAILADHALPALDVEVVWLKPGPADDAHLKVVDIGRALGAPNLLCVSADPDDAAVAAKLHRLCEHAEGGIRIALEFGLFTAVKSIQQASRILQSVNHPAAAMLIDPLHLARSGGTPADVAAIPRAWLPYAQFCDAGPLGYDLADPKAVIAEAVDGRLHVGEGILPLRDLALALPPETPLSIELRSRALREQHPDATARARAVLAATRAFFGAEGHATSG